MAAIPTGLIVLLLGGGCLGWWRLSILAGGFGITESVPHQENLPFKIDPPLKDRSPGVFNVVWPRSWRSGLGILMGYGVMQFSGLV